MNKNRGSENILKEQIFQMFMFFFSIMSFITLLVYSEINHWDFEPLLLFISVYTLILGLLAYKRVFTKILHKTGIYSALIIILPMLWMRDAFLAPKIAYTILIFLLINYLTQKYERIILNTLGILMVQLLIITFNRDFNYVAIWITLPFILSFTAILVIITERSYIIEKRYREQKELQLTELTRTDYLTGLYNRKYMEQKLQTFHYIWKRGVQFYSLIMIDIDFFKNYNDFYGHMKGDSCLKLISSILISQINRETDYAFRYGGEEFLILLGFTDKNGVSLVANRIKESIEKAAIPHEKSYIDKIITVSMGTATVTESYNSFADLIDKADRALYAAKDSGRNRIIHYEEELILT